MQGGKGCDGLASHPGRHSNAPSCLIMQKLNTLFAKVMCNLHPLYNSNYEIKVKGIVVKIIYITTMLTIHYKMCLLRSNN